MSLPRPFAPRSSAPSGPVASRLLPRLLVGAVAVSPLFAQVAFAQPKPSASPSVSAAPSPAPSAPTTGLSAVEVAGKVQKAYESINSYEAEFTQTYQAKAFGVEKKEHKGTVTFVKPGKMRWDYTTPKGNLVVSDGTTLWSYTPAENQARKMAVKDSQMPTALSFLMGKGDLTKDFVITLAAKQNMTGGYVLEAKPKVATNLYQSVLFYIDGATFHVRSVLIQDPQDNRNKFVFEKPKVNGKVEATVFTWTAPKGVTVVTN